MTVNDSSSLPFRRSDSIVCALRTDLLRLWDRISFPFRLEFWSADLHLTPNLSLDLIPNLFEYKQANLIVTQVSSR